MLAATESEDRGQRDSTMPQARNPVSRDVCVHSEMGAAAILVFPLPRSND